MIFVLEAAESGSNGLKHNLARQTDFPAEAAGKLKVNDLLLCSNWGS